VALPIWAARLVPSNVTTEHYPLPENIFGSVDPALPEGIGKIAMLSALLENKVAAIASSLENKQQSHYFKATFQSNKEVCRERLPLFEREPNRSDDVAAIRSFISRVSGAMAERNDVLHRVWLALMDAPGVALGITQNQFRHGERHAEKRIRTGQAGKTMTPTHSDGS